MTPGSERPAASRLMVAGNWKMNTTVEEGVALARAVATTVSTRRGLNRHYPRLWRA